ncbi:hypothetical protein B1757_13385 [Acidithiobacillus marinus]|uniref:Uncharacterized protein n=1 Tax=Acidithiobacillus marinus TaxID=187490 RepID=A0A2I1DIL9_9PROT|nr:hypothetical protein [Acidithiobacillus marinus]PKY09716.1 hypothetical protein B1757_13385 [Acidithiobacillus marinus]
MNIVVVEGATKYVGYSESKNGHIIGVHTLKGAVRVFIPGQEDMEIPEHIRVNGYIRSEPYSDGKVILEEVVAEMWSPKDPGPGPCNANIAVTKRSTDDLEDLKGLEDMWIPPEFPEDIGG